MFEEYVNRVIRGNIFAIQEDKMLIHLANVEAPKADNPSGIAAQNYLRGLIEHETVLIKIVGEDESGRDVADVWCHGLYINDVMKSYVDF